MSSSYGSSHRTLVVGSAAPLEMSAGSFVSGEIPLKSGADSICTTRIRDDREREKREIGLLNDRLADYIEKVQFLKAENECLSHEIEILRRGFSGGDSISTFFSEEVSNAKLQVETILSRRVGFEKEIAVLSADVETYRKKSAEAFQLLRARRADHDVDIDKLPKIEAERKIRIVEEDVYRIRQENDGILLKIGRLNAAVHSELATKKELSVNVQALLQRVKHAQTENCSRIEQELNFIRRDQTDENRNCFRAELQAAIREIRSNCEEIIFRNSQELEYWYKSQLERIRVNSGHVHVDVNEEEIVTIRKTLTSVQSSVTTLQTRNIYLSQLIEEFNRQHNEEARIFEISLAEKGAEISKIKQHCTEMTIQMEKLYDDAISLKAELERYRVLLNGANVTVSTTSNTSSLSSRHLVRDDIEGVLLGSHGI
ncbi:unnamed protein product [Caenorhabditis sp. 36 PRJEB53466]|nr:unnamed protein product [Caenorhabditis sp. 36 PRJEB53466]